MAFGAARKSGAELAVGITGLAGPGGALPGKPVGTVYLAGADTRTNTGYLMRLTLGGYQDRAIIRTRAALYALDMLRRMALGLMCRRAYRLLRRPPTAIWIYKAIERFHHGQHSTENSACFRAYGRGGVQRTAADPRRCAAGLRLLERDGEFAICVQVSAPQPRHGGAIL